jgi:hypothetical protein
LTWGEAPKLPKITSFTASPHTIEKSKKESIPPEINFFWTIEGDADTGSIEPEGSVHPEDGLAEKPVPEKTQQYILTVTGFVLGETDSAATTVTVAPSTVTITSPHQDELVEAVVRVSGVITPVNEAVFRHPKYEALVQERLVAERRNPATNTFASTMSSTYLARLCLLQTRRLICRPATSVSCSVRALSARRRCICSKTRVFSAIAWRATSDQLISRNLLIFAFRSSGMVSVKLAISPPPSDSVYPV